MSEHDSSKVFPWENEMQHRLSACIGHNDYRPVQEALQFLLSELEVYVHSCFSEGKCKRATHLCLVLRNFLTHLALRRKTFHSDAPVQSIDLLTMSVLAVLLDVQIFQTLRDKKPVCRENAIEQIVRDVVLFTGSDLRLLWDVLLKSTALKERADKVLNYAVLERLMAETNLQNHVTKPEDYLKCLLCFRILYKNSGKEQKRSVLAKTLELPAPRHLGRWLNSHGTQGLPPFQKKEGLRTFVKPFLKTIQNSSADDLFKALSSSAAEENNERNDSHSVWYDYQNISWKKPVRDSLAIGHEKDQTEDERVLQIEIDIDIANLKDYSCSSCSDESESTSPEPETLKSFSTLMDDNSSDDSCNENTKRSAKNSPVLSPNKSSPLYLSISSDSESEKDPKYAKTIQCASKKSTSKCSTFFQQNDVAHYKCGNNDVLEDNSNSTEENFTMNQSVQCSIAPSSVKLEKLQNSPQNKVTQNLTLLSEKDEGQNEGNTKNTRLRNKRTRRSLSHEIVNLSDDSSSNFFNNTGTQTEFSGSNDSSNLPVIIEQPTLPDTTVPSVIGSCEDTRSNDCVSSQTNNIKSSVSSAINADNNCHSPLDTPQNVFSVINHWSVLQRPPLNRSNEANRLPLERTSHATSTLGGNLENESSSLYNNYFKVTTTNMTISFQKRADDEMPVLNKISDDESLNESTKSCIHEINEHATVQSPPLVLDSDSNDASLQELNTVDQCDSRSPQPSIPSIISENLKENVLSKSSCAITPVKCASGQTDNEIVKQSADKSVIFYNEMCGGSTSSGNKTRIVPIVRCNESSDDVLSSKNREVRTLRNMEERTLTNNVVSSEDSEILAGQFDGQLITDFENESDGNSDITTPRNSPIPSLSISNTTSKMFEKSDSLSDTEILPGDSSNRSSLMIAANEPLRMFENNLQLNNDSLSDTETLPCDSPKRPSLKIKNEENSFLKKVQKTDLGSKTSKVTVIQFSDTSSSTDISPPVQEGQCEDSEHDSVVSDSQSSEDDLPLVNFSRFLKDTESEHSKAKASCPNNQRIPLKSATGFSTMIPVLERTPFKLLAHSRTQKNHGVNLDTILNEIADATRQNESNAMHPSSSSDSRVILTQTPSVSNVSLCTQRAVSQSTRGTGESRIGTTDLSSQKDVSVRSAARKSFRRRMRDKSTPDKVIDVKRRRTSRGDLTISSETLDKNQNVELPGTSKESEGYSFRPRRRVTRSQKSFF